MNLFDYELIYLLKLRYPDSSWIIITRLLFSALPDGFSAEPSICKYSLSVEAPRGLDEAWDPLVTPGDS